MRGRRIRGVIGKLSLNQSDLAKTAGINRSQLSQFLHSRVDLTDVQLTAIAVGIRQLASKQLHSVLNALTETEAQ